MGEGDAGRVSKVSIAIAAGAALLHLATATVYPLFRDELYYLACADHLDWGYVDHPSLSIAVLWMARGLLGDSVWVLRSVPAVADAALVLLAARLARELGGAGFAQGLTALCVALAPVYLALTGYYSMNAFDLVFWALLALLVVAIIKRDDPRLWLPFGAVAGLGLMNKISVLFFGGGVAVALVSTPLRRHLATRYPWLGGLIAGVVASPYLLWQPSHGWATLEFMHNAQTFKIAPLTTAQFLVEQVQQMLPFSAPLWLGGLWAVFFHRDLKRFRPLGIVFAVALLLMLVQRAKPYYLAAAYVSLLAAGAVWFEGLTARRRLGWLRSLVSVVLVLGGAVAVPLVVPVLPVPTFLAYQAALGRSPGSDEKQAVGPLPQFFADRFGWEEMTAAVAAAYGALPPEDRAKVMILASNYGEAGAINYYGRRYGLPEAYSQHNSFFFWGPKGDSADVVIMVGRKPEDLKGKFDRVVEAGRVEAPYAMPYETRWPVLVCYGLKPPLQEAWRQGRHFI
jgi:Dolichyl-phosphate-mannose-protein mannosyltransferase